MGSARSSRWWWALVGGVSLATSGCAAAATSRITFEAASADAEIRVDGELVGKGRATVLVIPAQGAPRTVVVEARRPGHAPLRRQVDTELDVGRALWASAPWAAFGGLGFALQAFQVAPGAGFWQGVGIVSAARIPIELLLGNHRFRPVYKLEPEPARPEVSRP